jgi:drug/metabolite transporter (DMT)-like permease
MLFTRAHIGMLELAFAQFMISIGLIIAKTLIPVIPLYLMQTIRFSCSAVFLFSLMMWQEKDGLQQLRTVLSDSKLRWPLFWQALCGGFLFNVFMVMGLQYTSASVAGIIAAALPAMLASLSWFILHEKISGMQSGSILIAVLGLILVAMPSQNSQFGIQWLGDLFVILALLPEAGFTILAKKQKIPLGILPLSTIICAINALCFLPFAIWQESTHANAISNIQFITIAAYGIAAASFFIFWYRGLQDNSAATAALMTSVMPIGTALLAFVFLQEGLTRSQIIGMGFVIFSIFLGSGGLPSRRKAVQL